MKARKFESYYTWNVMLGCGKKTGGDEKAEKIIKRLPLQALYILSSRVIKFSTSPPYDIEDEGECNVVRNFMVPKQTPS